MERLSNSILNRCDYNYRRAVNFSQSLYNFPVTLNYGPKHGRTKYILGCGSSDTISIFKWGEDLYVVSENTALSYISLAVINTETREMAGDVFLNSSDCTDDKDAISYGILDLDAESQLKILLEYIQ